MGVGVGWGWGRGEVYAGSANRPGTVLSLFPWLRSCPLSNQITQWLGACALVIENVFESPLWCLSECDCGDFNYPTLLVFRALKIFKMNIKRFCPL